MTLPLIVPGIVAAAMLSFALSLDDFIITYFVSGSTVTYPLFVNAAVKAAVPPQINVLATAILVISLVLLLVGTLYRRKRASTSDGYGASRRDGHRDAASLVACGDGVAGAVAAVEAEQVIGRPRRGSSATSSCRRASTRRW